MLINHQHFYWDKEIESEGLDPVSVHIESYPAEGQDNPLIGAPFHLDIRCYGRIWTTFFSSPGAAVPTAAIRGRDVEQLADRLLQSVGMTKSAAALDRKYLVKILKAIKPKILDEDESRALYLQNLMEQDGVQLVDYTAPELAPRFDQVVLVKYMNAPDLHGPAPANFFDWHQIEGQPSIDKFWIMPGERSDYPH